MYISSAVNILPLPLLGPAEVPMMSPNGSIPPIHVPPGYISQVNHVTDFSTHCWPCRFKRIYGFKDSPPGINLVRRVIELWDVFVFVCFGFLFFMCVHLGTTWSLHDSCCLTSQKVSWRKIQ